MSTTSGSYVSVLNRQEMVNAAFRLIGVAVRVETLSAEDEANGAEALELMLKHWMTQGLQLWARHRIVVFMAADKVRYQLGPSGDEACFEEDLVQTTILNAAALGATTIDVTSTTGMTAGDNIGFVQDDGTLFWTTIASVDDADTVTVDDALTAAAAAANDVFSYPITPAIPRPLRMYDGFIRNWNSVPNDTSLLQISQQEYRVLGSKTTEGTVNQYYYDPQTGTGAYDPLLSKGDLYVFPEPADVSRTLHFIAHTPFQNIGGVSTDIDFPQEWQQAMRYGLAVQLAMEYAYPAQNLQMLVGLADRYLDDVSGWDQEPASVYFGMDQSRMGGRA